MNRFERIITILFGILICTVSLLLIYLFLVPLSNLYQGLDANKDLLTMSVVFYGLEIIVGVILIFWGLFFHNNKRKYTKILWVLGGFFGFLMVPAFYYFVLNNIYSLLEAY